MTELSIEDKLGHLEMRIIGLEATLRQMSRPPYNGDNPMSINPSMQPNVPTFPHPFIQPFGSTPDCSQFGPVPMPTPQSGGMPTCPINYKDDDGNELNLTDKRATTHRDLMLTLNKLPPYLVLDHAGPKALEALEEIVLKLEEAHKIYIEESESENMVKE